MKLRTLKSDDPCGTALLQACEQAGIPTVPFNSGRTVVRGANWFQINSDENNIRQSSSVACLHPILGKRPNLEVRTGVRAKKLLLDGRRCAGAEYLDPDLIHTRTVRARREVIVSCGAIDSPKRLMLSGIGPAGHLREVGVDVVVDAPGVGENLRDHPEGVIMWEARQPMTTTSSRWWEAAELAPGPQVRTDDELLDYIHTTHNTVYHPSCTVKMGADDDPSAPPSW